VKKDPRNSSQLLDRLCDLSGFGETSQLPFREDDFTIDLDLEDTVATPDQPGICTEFVFQLGRQPGGTWLVVSNNAVFNADIHHNSTIYNPSDW